MKKKYLAIPILVLLASVVVVGASGVTNTQEETLEDGVRYHSMVTVEKNGEVVSQSPNTFLTSGQDWLIGQVGDVSETSADYDGATSDYVDTMYVTDGTTDHLSTDSLSWSHSSTGNITTTESFDATSEITVNTTRISISTAEDGETDFAQNTFTEVTLQDGDSIDVTWQVWTE